ncbi:hypothetical protein GCM10027169_38400 [Gordonia jinhuaensis]|uniref:DUF4185 domain-containing protein n=1 Tax=Gordonia jinhuaensis TaxID=1517702 RepID=A0A916SZP8_9ACTN|nr:DUF4185 domain-containing protein [Gordonia jinhuaensis]GGB25400.1 hypothetical protein GCM10011489_12030 [Gordonia jinhuaensis]
MHSEVRVAVAVAGNRRGRVVTGVIAVVSTGLVSGGAAVAAPAFAGSPDLPSSGCVNDKPAPDDGGTGSAGSSVLPEKITIGIPYPHVFTVPMPAPADPAPVRIPSQKPLPNICVDPCPDITGTPTQNALTSGSAFIRIPKVQVTPSPINIAIPVPNPNPPVLPPRPPAAAPGTAPAPQAARPSAPSVSGLTDVGTVTGRGSTSRTDKRWQINGTDLGIMWQAAPGKVAVAFGDTFGQGFTPPGANGTDWRSNVLGFSGTTDLDKGLFIDTMVQDSRCHAAQGVESQDRRYRADHHPDLGVRAGQPSVHELHVGAQLGTGGWRVAHQLRRPRLLR